MSWLPGSISAARAVAFALVALVLGVFLAAMRRRGDGRDCER